MYWVVVLHCSHLYDIYHLIIVLQERFFLLWRKQKAARNTRHAMSFYGGYTTVPTLPLSRRHALAVHALAPGPAEPRGA